MIGTLPDSEGGVIAQVRAEFSEGVILADLLTTLAINSCLVHGDSGKTGCGCVMNVFRVSQIEQVLFCPSCGTRFRFPAHIKTAGNLKELLREKITHERR